MTNIKITSLKSSEDNSSGLELSVKGSELFLDSESYLKDLTDYDDMVGIQGGSTPILLVSAFARSAAAGAGFALGKRLFG